MSFPADTIRPMRRRYIVCGDNTLAYRLITELRTLPDTDVTVLMRRSQSTGEAPIESLHGVELITVDHLDTEALELARIVDSEAIALTEQDDVGNLDVALLVREVAPHVRIVLRMFDEVLADAVHGLVTDCAVLSATAVAAPAFVAAAVGSQAPIPLRLFNRTVYVTERAHSRREDVLCGLAVTKGVAEPFVLPEDQIEADLILGTATGSDSPAVVASTMDMHRRARRRALVGLLSLVGRRLRFVAAALIAIILVGTAILMPLEHVNAWKAFYLAVLSTFAGSSPDLSANTGMQVLHIFFTILSIALIPLVTATVVETVVSARLALAGGGLIGPIEDHVVIAGLGDVGTRVLTALDDLGLAVVGIDRDPNARGVEVARERRVPVIVGDVGRLATLRSASVQSARSLVVLTSSDLANVQTALLARKINEAIRPVLRLFDGDFAERIQRTLAFTTSRSVSALAAPSFAAAMLDHEVVATIPVRRRVLLVAEVPVGTGSELDGRTVGEVQHPGQVRIVAIRTGRGAQVLWQPPAGRRLTRTDTILTVSTRDGLGDVLHQAIPTEATPAITPFV
jgi:Trk K+ transport system NAD-binding subunit